MNPARGRHGTGQKGEGSARSVGVGVTIPRHLGARRLLQEPVDIRVAQLTVAPHVREMVTAELVCVGTASNDRMPTVIELGVLDDKITSTCLALGLLHQRNMWRTVDRPELLMLSMR